MPDGSILPQLHRPDIFNTPAYLDLHRNTLPGPVIRHATPHGAFQAVQTAPGLYTSPGRAPYGGFDMPANTPEAARARFIHQAETAIRVTGASVLELVPPPLCYAPAANARALTLLCRLGYIVTRQELNQSLPVDDRPFATRATYAARKRLQKAARLGVTAHRLDPTDHMAAYATIQDNRHKKGRALSMPWSDLVAMTQAFPNEIHLFGARQSGQMIAAAICVAVNPHVLYVYAWGEAAGAETASPVTTLAQCIHAFAAMNHFTLLDLGTSSIDGIVDTGLHAFKRSLGAEPSLKLWLRKALA